MRLSLISVTSFCRLLTGVVLSLSLVLSVAYAQEKTLTIEELEAYIAEKKEALELARENQEVTKQKADEIKETLAAKQQAADELLAEMEELCTAREEVDPGSFEACMENVDSP